MPLDSEWMSVKICVMQAATNVVPSLETHVSIEHMYIVCQQLFQVWQIQELLSVNLTVCLTSFRRCEVAKTAELANSANRNLAVCQAHAHKVFYKVHFVHEQETTWKSDSILLEP